MKVHIKYFASIREAMGCSNEVVQTQAATVAALRDELLARGGLATEALARSRHVRVALNQALVEESAALSEACEVAFFPPVTGG
jgi:molybdopterin synthase sulfur carrier subunit